MSVATSISTLEVRKCSTLTHILMYIFQHMFQIGMIITFAGRTTKYIAVIVLHYKLTKCTKSLALAFLVINNAMVLGKQRSSIV